jgi:hypothetical protein
MATPNMCRSRLGGSPLDVHALLEEAESLNYAVAGFNDSVTQPSKTMTVVTAGLGVVSSGGQFILLVFAMVFSLFGWFAFWFCPKRLSIVPLGFLFTAMAYGIGAAAWLNQSANQTKSRLDSIDAQYARGAKVGSVFMGLLWSAAVGLILSFLSAVVAIWMNLRDEEHRSQRQIVNEEEPMLRPLEDVTEEQTESQNQIEELGKREKEQDEKKGDDNPMAKDEGRATTQKEGEPAL